jgi:hypothetical protein
MPSAFPRKLRVAAGSVLALCLLAGAAHAQPYGKGGNYMLALSKPASKSTAAPKAETPKPAPTKATRVGATVAANDTAAAPVEAPAPTGR